MRRRAKDDARKVCGVVMARDSRQPVTLRQPPELRRQENEGKRMKPVGPDSFATILLPKFVCMVGCDSVPPNDPSSATRPTRALDCNRDAMAGFAAAHG